MSAPSQPARGSLPLAPPEYSQQHMNTLIRQLEIVFNYFDNPGAIICTGDSSADSKTKSGLNIQRIPTSATGLLSGDVWADVSGSATVFSGTADVSGGVLNVTAVASGTLSIGNGITGTDFPNGTKIVDVGTGTGGVGTYILNQNFTVASGSVTGYTSPVLRIVP